MSIPDAKTLAEMKFEDLKNLQIVKIEWDYWNSLGFTLSNGQTCKAGLTDFNQSYTVY